MQPLHRHGADWHRVVQTGYPPGNSLCTAQNNRALPLEPQIHNMPSLFSPSLQLSALSTAPRYQICISIYFLFVRVPPVLQGAEKALSCSSAHLVDAAGFESSGILPSELPVLNGTANPPASPTYGNGHRAFCNSTSRFPSLFWDLTHVHNIIPKSLMRALKKPQDWSIFQSPCAPGEEHFQWSRLVVKHPASCSQSPWLSCTESTAASSSARPYSALNYINLANLEQLHFHSITWFNGEQHLVCFLGSCCVIGNRLELLTH